MTLDFSDSAYGLTTDIQRHVNRMLHEYSPILSLRRIPERDPAFSPAKPYGVWEETALTESKWVFTLAEMSIDMRVLARIAEGDMLKEGAPAKFAKWASFMAARDADVAAAERERQEQREDEMLFIGKAAEKQSQVRHVIDGELMIIGDGNKVRRPSKTFIS